MKPRVSNPFISQITALAALLATSSVHAASGTWLGTSGDWGVAGTWSGGTIADGIDSTANFTGVDITADQIINLDAARTIGNITYTDLTTASNNLTISGANILTLDRSSGVPTIDVTQTGRTLTISSQISGADGLQKNGTGILSLSGNNDYTGTTVISNGILAISSNNALGATSGNTTIAATGASTGPRLEISGNINSAENISLTGNTEQNQFNGAIINISGTNTLSGNITLANPAGNIRFTSGGGELIFGGTISQTTSTRTLVLQAVAGAAITVNNAIANNNGALSILGGAGGGASNGVTLKTASPNIGNTQVMENGLLKLGVNNALDTTANLTLGVAQNFAGNGGFDFGKFDLAGFNQTVAALAGIRNSGNTIGADSNRIVTNSAAATTSVLTVSSGNFLGVILDGAGKVALTKVGAGDLSLAGTTSSSYTGTTTVSAGRIIVTTAGQLSSGATSIAQSGTGQVFVNSGATISNPFNISTNGYLEPGDSQNNVNGAIRMSGGTLSGQITLSGNSRIAAFGTSTNTISGKITGGFGIDFYGFQNAASAAPVFVLSNTTNDYTGNTTIYNSNYNTTNLTGVTTTLRLGASNVIPNGASVGNVAFAINGTNNNAVVIFDLNGFSETINGLTVNAGTFATRITNTAAATSASALTIGANDTTSSFSGTITDSGAGRTLAITKIGSGNLTLSGSNAYIGGTTIDAGTVTLGHATNTLANGGAVNVNGGTLAIGTNTDTVGAVTLTSGSITGSGAGTLTGTGSAFDVRSGTISAKIAGSVGLNKTTGGTVTISSDNSSGGYTGATSVSAGVLAINGALANTTTTISGTGTLQGSGSIAGSVSISSGGTLAPGNSIESLGVGALSFATGSTYAYELQSNLIGGSPNTSADLTFSSGSLDIAAGSFLTLTDLATSTALAINTKLTLISYFGGWTSTELFTYNAATLADGGTFTLGANTWAFNYDDTTGGINYTGDYGSSTHFVTMTVVPEPRAALLGGLGMLALLRRRRQ